MLFKLIIPELQADLSGKRINALIDEYCADVSAAHLREIIASAEKLALKIDVIQYTVVYKQKARSCNDMLWWVNIVWIYPSPTYAKNRFGGETSH